MVDVTAPLRTEPLFDVTRGLNGEAVFTTTVRFATFLDNLASTSNENTVIIEETSEGFELQQVQSFTSELKKDIDDIDQLSLINSLNAKVAEMQKQINNLEELVE